MNLIEYFDKASRLEEGFPLTAFQAEVLFPRQDIFLIPRNMALQPCYRVEMGWFVPELDVPRLQQAAMAVVRRHQALRSTLVLDGELPKQRSTQALHLDQFFRTCEHAETMESAVEIGRACTSNIPVDGPSPFRVVVIPSGGRHCVLVAIHHCFADMDGLGVAVRDLWRAYEGADIASGPSFTYEQQCREHAELYTGGNLLNGHLSYWAQENRWPTALKMQSGENDLLYGPRMEMQTFTLDDGSTQINDYARRHRVLPVSVLLTSLTEALGPWLSDHDDITVLLTVAGSRLNRRLSNEVQCSILHRPVTLGNDVFRTSTRVEQCQAWTRSIFKMLRHSAVPAAALPQGRPGLNGGVVLNALSYPSSLSDNSSFLSNLAPIPRHAPHLDFKEEDLNNAFVSEGQPDRLWCQVISHDRPLTVVLSRFSSLAGITEPLGQGLKEIFSEIANEAPAGISQELC